MKDAEGKLEVFGQSSCGPSTIRLFRLLAAIAPRGPRQDKRASERANASARANASQLQAGTNDQLCTARDEGGREV